MVFWGNFPIFVLMAGEKCCKLVLHVDKTIILSLAMMTVMMHAHLNTGQCKTQSADRG